MMCVRDEGKHPGKYFVFSFSERATSRDLIFLNRFCNFYWSNRWRPSRQESLASAAGTSGSSCTDGRSGSSRLMAWTRLPPPMFSHFLVRPRRRRRSLCTNTVSLLALVMMIGKFYSLNYWMSLSQTKISIPLFSSCPLLKRCWAWGGNDGKFSQEKKESHFLKLLFHSMMSSSPSMSIFIFPLPVWSVSLHGFLSV